MIAELRAWSARNTILFALIVVSIYLAVLAFIVNVVLKEVDFLGWRAIAITAVTAFPVSWFIKWFTTGPESGLEKDRGQEGSGTGL